MPSLVDLCQDRASISQAERLIFRCYSSLPNAGVKGLGLQHGSLTKEEMQSQSVVTSSVGKGDLPLLSRTETSQAPPRTSIRSGSDATMSLGYHTEELGFVLSTSDVDTSRSTRHECKIFHDDGLAVEGLKEHCLPCTDEIKFAPSVVPVCDSQVSASVALQRHSLVKPVLPPAAEPWTLVGCTREDCFANLHVF